MPIPDLTPWQKQIAEHLIAKTPRHLLVNRGRRVGWTVMLRHVEEALKWRGPGPLHLWDGRWFDPDSGEIVEDPNADS